jgi:NAD(P)-dependent dehydrogenase (short-subunit alcohol dehydrogenase family)
LREAAAALAGELGSAVHWAPCDVTDEAAVERAVAVAAEPLGGLHVAVASAGGGAGGPILSTGLDMWRYVMDVNVTGTFLTVKHTGQAMVRSGGGAIVAISSIAAVLTHRLMAPYCTSKAAIEMLVRCVADELGPLGVRANAVRPGLVPTELAAPLADDREVVDDYLDQMPLRRLGTPEDVSAAVRYLAGPESSWVTGQVFAGRRRAHPAPRPVRRLDDRALLRRRGAGRHPRAQALTPDQTVAHAGSARCARPCRSDWARRPPLRCRARGPFQPRRSRRRRRRRASRRSVTGITTSSIVASGIISSDRASEPCATSRRVGVASPVPARPPDMQAGHPALRSLPHAPRWPRPQSPPCRCAAWAACEALVYDTGGDRLPSGTRDCDLHDSTMAIIGLIVALMLFKHFAREYRRYHRQLR